MKSTEQLLALLACQRQTLSRLLQLVRDERECLVRNQLTPLEEIVQQQSVLLTEQSVMSTRITRVLRRLSLELGLAEHSALTLVCAHLDEPEATEAREHYQELVTMAGELQREGQINWHLAQQALRYIDFTLRAISCSREEPQPYSPTLAITARRPAQLLMDSCA